jgi:hypothetical protein
LSEKVSKKDLLFAGILSWIFHFHGSDMGKKVRQGGFLWCVLMELLFHGSKAQNLGEGFFVGVKKMEQLEKNRKEMIPTRNARRSFRAACNTEIVVKEEHS